MTTRVLEETGYFWWGDTPLPSGQFAPESAVVGKLSIDEEGYSRLELEGVFPNELGPLAHSEAAVHRCLRIKSSTGS